MTLPAAFSFDAPGDARRAAELRRVKALATLVLAGTLAVFAIAKLLLNVHPVFGFVAAFAEAATIGGLPGRYAARLCAGAPASSAARRSHACGSRHADAGRDHGDDPRKSPQPVADAAKTLSYRQIPGEQDRRFRDRILRRGPQRSQTPVPRRVRFNAAVVRRSAR